MRADARRNYDKILETARTAFRERGYDCSLDEIARTAGVGAGTLYRHFPSREDLIDAVMQQWADRVHADAAAVVAAGGTPRATLTEWFSRFLGSGSVYQGAAAKVVPAMDDPASPLHRKCLVLVDANRLVLESDQVRPGVRDGVDPREVMRLLGGACAAVQQAHLDAEQAAPMLRILLDGVLRPDAA